MKYDGHSRPTGTLWEAADRERAFLKKGYSWTRGEATMAAVLMLVIAALVAVLFAMPANAQRTVTIATCGTLTQGTPALGSAGIIALDQNGNVCSSSTLSGASVTPVIGASSLVTGTGWTSGTAGNATQTLMSTYGAPAVLTQLVQTSTISAGAVTFEGTYDGTNWVSVPVAQLLNPNTLAPLTNPYTLVASTNQPFLLLSQGYQQLRVRLSTGITGSGTVTPFTANLNYNPALGALLNPLAAGTAIVGKVGIDQTTPGTTNGVAVVGVNGATALAGNGATGTGSARVTLSNDNTIPTGWPTAANQIAAPDPCMYANKTNLAISQNGTSSVQLIALSGSTVIYVCSLVLIAAGATTVALTTGTGSACVTGNAAVIGTTTANIANSISLAANGGLTSGNGQGTIAKGAASSELCMINGSNVFVSGNLTYVQQ